MLTGDSAALKSIIKCAKHMWECFIFSQLGVRFDCSSTVPVIFLEQNSMARRKRWFDNASYLKPLPRKFTKVIFWILANKIL